MTESLCRICLDGNIKTHSYENIKLQEIYVKLSSSKFNTGDGRPEAVCYICHSQLLRCWKFSDMMCRSEKLLNNLIDDNIQITKKNVFKRHHGLRFNLAVSDTHFVTITGDCVKEEPNVKEEIECELIESNNVPLKQENTENNAFREKSQDVKVEAVDHTFTADDNRDSKMNIHNDRPNECKINRDNNYSTECNDKTLRITDQNTFNCQKCDEKFKKKQTLTLHMRMHTDEPVNMSKNEQSYPRTAKQHLEKQTFSQGKKYNFICSTCNKAFKTKSYLIRHMSTHMVAKPYNCKECDKTYVKKLSLDNHMRLHIGGLFGCDHCGKQFHTKGNLREHMGIHGSVKGFVCEICQKALSTRSTLKTHMMMHANEKLHTCHDCGRSFLQKCNMVSHMKIHTGEKPYACSSCNKRFCRQDYLKKHMITHLIVRESYECSICNMFFLRKDSLSKHKLTHTEKSLVYACLICEKPFRNKRDVKVHMRSHIPKKIFECLECHKVFTTQSHLSRHRKFIHMGIKEFACDVCDKRFYQKDNMRSHMDKRHSIK